MNWLMVFLGGGLGSMLRYFISLTTASYNKSTFPIATFTANILSCFIVGIAIEFYSKSYSIEHGKMFFITGFCGGLSTFSALSTEVLILLQKNYAGMAFLYIVLSMATGLTVLWIGMQVAK